MVGLPDVRGYNVNDAQRTLEDDGFKVKRVDRFDNAQQDSVIDQKPAARSQVHKGAMIALTVSKGPQTVAAPNFVNMAVGDAQTMAAKLGITLDTSQQAADANVGSGVVLSQDVLPGTSLQRGGTIHATVSTGPATNAQAIVVPSLIGTGYASAVSQLQQLGLQPAITFSTQSDKNGTIVNQDPPPGAQVATGKRVTLTLSINGQIPDTEGETVADAEATLAADGYLVGKIQYTTAEGANGHVIRTDPAVGENLTPGSTVTLIVNGTGP
jgi:serine/threonine-protein kinase